MPDPARNLEERIASALGAPVAARAPLAGGCVSEVARVRLTDGRELVAKSGAAGALACEAWMLHHLAAHTRLPVPAVLHAEDGLLLIAFVPSGDAITPAAETHAAELLAELHGISAETFGFERDTVIGGLAQPNPRVADWRDFFRDHRLLHMAGAAHAAGAVDAALMARIEAFAGRLEEWIAPGTRPSLIHGDMWGGNVLVRDGRIAGFVDPAIYYADAEIELAFATLFATFGEPFFRRYGELRGIAPGFWEARRDIYNLYPLLVHARLFGPSYAARVARTLARFGG